MKVRIRPSNVVKDNVMKIVDHDGAVEITSEDGSTETLRLKDFGITLIVSG